LARIITDDISVDFPIASLRARSLKNILLSRASSIGGRVVDAGTSVAVVRALDGVSFELNDGDRLALIGHNGSGKTTLIRALSDIYAPTRGRIRIEGRRVPLFDINLGFDDESTGYENIYIRGLIMGLSERAIAEKTREIAEFSGLGQYLDLPIRTYSSGMVLRLMFSIATAAEGDIVIMDEWIGVGDADFRTKANDGLRAMTERSGILVLASHDFALLRGLCNLGLHLEAGRIRSFGAIEEVLAQAA
jgi:ABC-2 type transport system ATP-binding protein/lipopolysaccharide transport system ATP-binding protein